MKPDDNAAILDVPAHQAFSIILDLAHGRL